MSTTREYLHFDCAHAPQHEAEFRRLLYGKMTWLCLAHSDYHALREAKEFTAARGLTAVKDMSEWVKAHPMGKGRMHGAFLEQFNRTSGRRGRIPGEDDE